MDKLQAMSVFVTIAEQSSLTGAANALGKSLPTVVRILAALEQDLQVRLFNRTTRKVAITEEGRIYLDHCQKILTEINEVEQLLSNDQLEPGGTITLTAPIRFGELYVAPAVSNFLKHYPKMSVKLLLLDRVVNMLDEGIDLAVRIARIDDSSMIAKPVGEIRQVVCASPEVIQKYGRPKQPKALSDLPCVIFTGLSAGEHWVFQSKGKSKSIKVNGRFTCNQVSSSVDSCITGLGFGMFLCYQVMPWVRQGKLEIVLEEFESKAVPVSIVFHHSRLLASRVRVFVDFLANHLKSSLK